jgi:ABC-type nitrate/sulfonate/bicarbonate transport system permease component
VSTSKIMAAEPGTTQPQPQSEPPSAPHWVEPPEPTGLIPRLGRFHESHRAFIRGTTTIVVLLILWQLIVGLFMKQSLAVATPSAIYHEYVALSNQGYLWKDIWTSLKEFIIGFAMAAVFGITLGLLMGGIRAVREYLDPVISGLYATPVIALGPLFILWFGIGINSKIAVVFILATLPIVINTESGIRTVDPHLIETAYAFSASRTQMFRKILLPGALPLLVTGLRLGVGRGLLGVVTGELFAAQSGLGYLSFVSSQQFNPAGVLVAITPVGFAVIFSAFLLRRIDTRLAPWRSDSE